MPRSDDDSGGIFLWKLQCKNANEAPVLMDVVTHPSQKGFHQVSWNADGRYEGMSGSLQCCVCAHSTLCSRMLAAFAKDTNVVYVIDTIFSRKTELLCSYPVASLNWSPTGEYLFISTE